MGVFAIFARFFYGLQPRILTNCLIVLCEETGGWWNANEPVVLSILFDKHLSPNLLKYIHLEFAFAVP